MKSQESKILLNHKIFELDRDDLEIINQIVDRLHRIKELKLQTIEKIIKSKKK